MKQLLFLSLFLFLLPCLAWAQYPSNGNQKITLGEQTTADGLIFRGVASTDTVRKPSIDTMAYMVLDTTTNIMWHYKKATSNAWLRLNLLPSDTASMLTNYWRSGRFSGVLPVANGGTNTSTAFTTGSVVFAGSGGTYTQANEDIRFIADSSRLVLGPNTILSTPPFNGVRFKSMGKIQIARSDEDNRFITIDNEGGQAQMNFGAPGAGYGSFKFTQSNNADTRTILHITGDGFFGVNENTAGNITQKLTVSGNGLFTGNVGIGSATPTASGTGITFPATQSASTSANTLDDYEEGTWTPAYEGLAGSAGSLAYASGFPRGRYTKIGRLVVATGEIELTNKGSWTSGVRIAGLPFNLSATEIAQGFCIAGFVDFAAGELYLNTRNTGGATPLFYFDKTKDNAEREILFTTAVNNNSTFYFSLTYQTN